MPEVIAWILIGLGLFGLIVPQLCIMSIMVWVTRNASHEMLDDSSPDSIVTRMMDRVFWTICPSREYKMLMAGSAILFLVGALGLQ